MKKFISVLFVLFLFLSVSSTAFAEDSLSWNLDKNGTLTISGTGEMPDFGANLSPWDSQRDSVKNIVIEEGVTYIGQESFEYCKNVKRVSIPSSVCGIGNAAFYHCTSLETITVPDGVTEIGEETFDHCAKLKTVFLPEGITSIGSAAFNCCSSLDTVVIPGSVEEILYSAFNACRALKTVYYTGTLSSWEDMEIEEYNAYLQAAAIQCIAPSKLPIILPGDSSVGPGSSSSSIRWMLDKSGTLTISGTGSMPDYSYNLSPWDSQRNDVKKIVIEYGIDHIGQESFEFCKNVKSVSIPESVKSIGDAAFFTCSKLESVTLPRGLTEIGQETFDHCAKLESIVLPDGVTVIGSAAFNCCSSLTSITIPQSVTEIKDSAFNACRNLKSVYYSGSSEDWAEIEISIYNGYLSNADIYTSDSNPNFNGGKLGSG